MRVLVFEPFSSGHRLQFVRMCVEAVGSMADEVILATCPSTPGADEFRTHLQSLVDGMTIDTSMGEASVTPWRAAIARLRGLRKVLRRLRPDHVYIPYADGLAQVCGAMHPFDGIGRRGMEIEAILMRGGFAYPSTGWWHQLSARASLAAMRRAPFTIFHHLDPIPYEAIHRMRHAEDFARRSRLIPEPVEPLHVLDRAEARRRLRLPEGGRCIVCPGSLGERKGTDRLIRAFAQADLRHDDWLLLAGRMDATVRRAFDAHHDLKRAGRLIALEGCLSDEDLHVSMSAADIVCAPYPRHIGSSGIIVRAAALLRPVLASQFGWVGMVTKRFNLGVTCDCLDPQALAQALPAALDHVATFRHTEAAARFTRFHTQVNFASHIAQRLRERLGRPAADDLRTWEWVVQAGNRSEAVTLAR